jgi:aspartyl-tRNA(Asn)/glutamyl-tRNA(Gln) amidotransferase subunit A
MKGILEGEQPPDDTIRWLSHAGLTTRSIQDTVLLLDVLAEQNTKASTWREAIAADAALRIGIADNVRADTEMADALARAVATIEGLGYAVSHAKAPLTDFTKGVATIEADRQSIGRLTFKDIDVLVLPTTTTATPTVKGAGRNSLALSPELTMFANYYGLPAASVPCGFDSRGLPVGLQIVAKPGDDGAVLRLACQYEAAAGLANRHPIT